MKRTIPVKLVRSGNKVSFCLADTEIDFWGKKGDGPRTYIAPDCLFPAYSDATNDYYFQGITPGWGDIYDYYLAGPVHRRERRPGRCVHSGDARRPGRPDEGSERSQ